VFGLAWGVLPPFDVGLGEHCGCENSRVVASDPSVWHANGATIGQGDSPREQQVWAVSPGGGEVAQTECAGRCHGGLALRVAVKNCDGEMAERCSFVTSTSRGDRRLRCFFGSRS
jgi:hypothetical protein